MTKKIIRTAAPSQPTPKQREAIQSVYAQEPYGISRKELTFWHPRSIVDRCIVKGFCTKDEVSGMIHITAQGMNAIEITTPIPTKTSFEGFIENVQYLLGKSAEYQEQLSMMWPPRSYYYNSSTPKADPHLYVEWETGGVSGGSCWDSSCPIAYVSNEPAPELAALDFLLEKMCPTVGFLTYKRILRSVVSSSTRRNNDYYGNHTDYACKSVSLRALYKFLKDENLLPK